MKQIDKQIAECKSVMDYVSKRVPTILESIENATNEFRISESEYKYSHLSNVIETYSKELVRLSFMEQQNRFSLESLEEIKYQDYEVVE
jgi:hypothetical protein